MRTFSLFMTIVLISLGVGQTPFAQGGVVTFTPIDFPGAKKTIPLDINDVGEIVGRYEDGTGKTHGFLLSAGNFTSIDYPHPDVAFTVAAGINPRGDIVGQYRLAAEDENRVRHGFLSHEGTFTTIDFPDATFTNALGINPRGDIVGRYCLAFKLCNELGLGNAHGYLRSMQGGFATIDFPGATETHAWKINARGQIVGNYRIGGTFHVFLYRQGGFTSIDFPEKVAVSTGANSGSGGINSRGDIVSEYCSAPCPTPSAQHGFLRSTRGGFATIDFPHAVRTVALGINTRGDIVGFYEVTINEPHGFLLSQYERDGDEDER
jgi:uncharacterized membrane protein